MSHFFAYLLRMKLIERWSLMRSTYRENIQEHSLEVGVIAHALAMIKNKYFDGNVPVERVALLALYHDATEVITGDLPTPVKYFNKQIKEAYKELEVHAGEKLVSLLPPDFQDEFRKLINPSDEPEETLLIIKAADTLSAYIKCLEEKSAGNPEFDRARKSLEERLHAYKLPEVDYFMEKFIPSFSLSLDELSDPFAQKDL